MSIALDVGAHRLRSMRMEKGRLVGRACRALYAVLEDSAQSRALLSQSQLTFAECDDALVLIGDAAAEFSRLFHVPCISLLGDGRIPRNDPPARQVLATIVDSLLPNPLMENEICCMSVPGLREDVGQGNDSKLDFFTHLVELRGYQPLVIRSSLATVLASMANTGFTGIGINLGASTCEMSFAFNGMELAQTTVPLGGNWLDTEIARYSEMYLWDADGSRYLKTEEAADWKNSPERSVVQQRTEGDKFLTDLYQELMSHLAKETVFACEQSMSNIEFARPVDVVVSGGLAQINGFQSMMENVWRSADFPFALGKIQILTDSEYTIARGCMIKAVLESGATTTDVNTESSMMSAPRMAA